MSWFGPKLEPREAVVLQKRSSWRHLLWLIAFILFAFLPLEFGLLLVDESAGISPGRLLVLVPVAAVSLLLPVLLLLFVEEGWKLAVTSRRLIHRPNGWLKTAEEIPVAEIEAVRHDIATNMILVRGGAKEISLDAELIQPDALNEAIARAKGALA